jgi:DNA mismatch endonuclease, patch repair protein
LVDIVDKATRSRMMAAIKGKNTKPEIAVRKALHAAGFRFTLHGKSLPGKPDIVLPKHKTAIFVHGCFWHGHNCKGFRWPKTRPVFWRAKILGNKKRDQLSRRRLKSLGWNSVVVWECKISQSLLATIVSDLQVNKLLVGANHA